ncbi:MAG: ABC transporter substrate-binding protein [Proteobacteria bacterium]|nr:ABC transporter substrate-binding protein [Pseudomonadota bacterium]
MSVDQCSDQYVMALAPRNWIVGVSPHADDSDAFLRRQAKGLPVRRPTLESLLAAHPDVVVRYWTSDQRLLNGLRQRGIKVVQIEDAKGFDDIRRNIRTISKALEREPQGQAMIAEMDAKLAKSRGAWGGRKALYLTPGGFTSGSGTLVEAIMDAAGLRNAVTAPGYQPVSLEKFVLQPPDLLVLGFFDEASGGRWDVGRRPLVRRIAKGRTVADLPADLLGCPGWFAADASVRLAEAARGQGAKGSR